MFVCACLCLLVCVDVFCCVWFDVCVVASIRFYLLFVWFPPCLCVCWFSASCSACCVCFCGVGLLLLSPVVSLGSLVGLLVLCLLYCVLFVLCVV